MTEEGDAPEEEEEAVVDDFMQGSLRANRLADLCEALRLRIRGLREDLARTESPQDREVLEGRIKDARVQLAVLKQELAISQFVEESVRVTLRDGTPRVQDFPEMEDLEDG